MKYNIREATFKDAEWIAKVHIQSWREAYAWIISEEYLANMSLDKRIETWQEVLSKKKEMSWDFVVETKEKEIVGFLSWWKARTEIENYKWELYAIYTLNVHQWNNLGYLLTRKLCTILKENGVFNMLVLVLENNKAKDFYIKYGAKFLKKIDEKVWTQDVVEEYYWWKNLDSFI